MHAQALRRILGAAIGVEECAQGVDQIGAVFLVVPDQLPERLVVKLVKLWQMFGGEQEPENAQIG